MTDRQSARARIEAQAIAEFESKPRDAGFRRTGAPTRASHEPAPTTEWFVVIPVRGTATAKSRLAIADPGAMAIAMAHDTVEAVLAAPGVTGVLVVTSDEAATAFDDLDAFILTEDPGGLDAAVAHGLDTARDFGEPGRGTAVMLGDLPALLPAELGAALDAARAHPRAMVADAVGTGTTLITAADGVDHEQHFGEGSAALHEGAGYVPLPLPADSGLRSDVDTVDDLERLTGRLGPATTALLDR